MTHRGPQIIHCRQHGREFETRGLNIVPSEDRNSNHCLSLRPRGDQFRFPSCKFYNSSFISTVVRLNLCMSFLLHGFALYLLRLNWRSYFTFCT